MLFVPPGVALKFHTWNHLRKHTPETDNLATPGGTVLASVKHTPDVVNLNLRFWQPLLLAPGAR